MGGLRATSHLPVFKFTVMFFKKKKKNPFQQQTGGNHYQGLSITPIEYAMANKLDACQFSVVKYITRFRDKNGLEDLKKAKDFIDMLIYSEYGKEDE